MDRSMFSPATRNYGDDCICKETTSARRRRLALRLHKLHITKPHTTSKTTSFSSCDYSYILAVHGGGSGREPNPSSSSTASSKGGTKSGTASSESSSSTTPFRRLDGDIRRHTGIPLTGEDIVDRDNKARGVNCSSHGSISVIGRRRVMEDTLTVAPSDFPTTHDFFGVYDGHGGVGVSSACRDNLHRYVGEEIEGWRGQRVDWEIVMRDCFKKMDDEVGDDELDFGFSGGVGGFEFCWPPFAVAPPRVRTVGATALVVVLSKEEIVVANCGDSRAVLFRNGHVLPLSNDHKVDRLDERERVEAGGGKVIDMNGLLRVEGVFKTTRSIGDHGLKSYMISDPEVTVTERNELDEFIIIATDGVWDVVSNEDACEVVEKSLAGHTRRTLEGETTKITAEAAAILAELAMAKGSKDNISVIVVDFKVRSGTHVS